MTDSTPAPAKPADPSPAASKPAAAKSKPASSDAKGTESTSKPSASAPSATSFWSQYRDLGRAAHGVAIVLYVVSILAWSVPGNAPLVARLRHIVEPVFIYTGIWQGWDMFSPNPLADNVWVEAEVTFPNGTKKVWPFPRMDRMGNWDKFRFERYRKWAVDRVRLDSYSGIWPETSRYVARIYYDDPAGPPREIALTRRWRTIKSPSEQWIDRGQEDTLPESSHTFYHYTVQPADIEPPPPGAR